MKHLIRIAIGFCLSIILTCVWQTLNYATTVVLDTNIHQQHTQKHESIYNPPSGDVRLLVISDLNGSYGSTDYDPEIDKAIELIPIWQPDLVVCAGDMIAGQKVSLSPTQIRAMWQAFDQHIAAPLRASKIPLALTIGNHDASSALDVNGNFTFAQERNLASEYWQHLEHDPGINISDRSQFPFYYTFEHQGIFFLVLDASSAHIPPEKLTYIENILASPEAQKAKMRIVLGHLPLYGIAEGRNKAGEVINNGEQLRQLLERYQVHTYISGHQHAYYPAYKGNLQLLHAGNLGGNSRKLINPNSSPRKTITVVDINLNAIPMTNYTTYNAQTWELIKPQQLPPFLSGYNGQINRSKQ